MRKVFLAIPTLTGRCTPATEQSVNLFEMESQACGWGFTQLRWAQDSLIAHARNCCLAKFLDSDATDLFCLDSDVACGPGAFTRLMSHREDFVAAAYRVKSETERYAVDGIDGGAWQDEETGLVEVKNVPFGFVRLRRSVIEKMVAANHDEWFMSNNKAPFRCPALFNTEIRDHLFHGEDFYFCRKWRETGGRIWLDPEIRLAHINGEGVPFAGSFADHLRAKKCPS